MPETLELALRPVLESIAIRFANEGVPIAAISRSMQQESSGLREVLHEAIDQGKLLAMPKEDWPPGSDPHDRLPVQFQINLDDDFLKVHIMKTFKLTRLRAKLFCKLLRSGLVTKEVLHTCVEENRGFREETTDIKIVDVVICHMRKQLKHHGIFIDTVWGVGYCMSDDMRKRAIDILNVPGLKPVIGVQS